MIAQELPIHFFTVVLNGQPFIQYHLQVFRELPFRWHWHVVEGVAELVHDSAWSVPLGGRVEPEMHREGRSNDGTTEYLDAIEAESPSAVTVYRKPQGVFWEGKREMVEAPLRKIHEPCLLWEVDADELWLPEQIVAMRRLFREQAHRTAAFYWCDYFVGPEAVISTRYNYAENPAQEWLRTWRFMPGAHWASHEPPVLVTASSPDRYVDLGRVAPFSHDETEAAGAKFQHFAYATEEQLRFKEAYYGYRGAVQSWHRLQNELSRSVFLRSYFPWVHDWAMADTAARASVIPLARPGHGGKWQFLSSGEFAARGHERKLAHPQLVFDSTFTARAQTGVRNVWAKLLSEWLRTGFADNFVLLDRAGRVVRVPGLRYRSLPDCGDDSEEDAAILERLCRDVGADLFVSAQYTMPTATPSVLIHGLLPAGSAPNRAGELGGKGRAMARRAMAHLVFSEESKRHLVRLCPDVEPGRILVVQNGGVPAMPPVITAERALRDIASRLV
jgi:hypothetical protein